jgi:hypothetical protein
MKNSNDTIGNRSRDLPVCSAVPQPPCAVGTGYISQGYSSRSVAPTTNPFAARPLSLGRAVPLLALIAISACNGTAWSLGLPFTNYTAIDIS